MVKGVVMEDATMMAEEGVMLEDSDGGDRSSVTGIICSDDGGR